MSIVYLFVFYIAVFFCNQIYLSGSRTPSVTVVKYGDYFNGTVDYVLTSNAEIITTKVNVTKKEKKKQIPSKSNLFNMEKNRTIDERVEVKPTASFHTVSPTLPPKVVTNAPTKSVRRTIFVQTREYIEQLKIPVSLLPEPDINPNRLDNHNVMLREDEFENVDPIKDDVDGPKVDHVEPQLYSFASGLAINDTIMVTMIDSGYLDLFYSFYTLSHMERYKNFFVISLDEGAHNELQSYNIPSYFYRDSKLDEEVHKQSVLITSKEFQKKVTNKLSLISILLGYKMRVLYMDCDIILFKNPWPYLNKFTHKTVDIVAQRDQSLNSGFMLLFPTEMTSNLMKHAHNHMLMHNELDQESILAVLPRFNKLRLSLLPEDLFANGKFFFSKYQFYWDTVKRKEIMMHNNFIVGSESKLYRLRELLYYNYDTDNYYSSVNRKYLIVDASVERVRTPLYLRQVAYVAHALNRTFLLPFFPCPTGFTASKCNLCRNDVECYKSFRQLIKGNYRDYAFRTHEKTPKEIKNAIEDNPVYTVEKTTNLQYINRNNVDVKTIYIYHKINFDTLAFSFRSFANERVLKLKDVPLSIPKQFYMCFFKQTDHCIDFTPYFLQAIASISIPTFLGRQATSTQERAG